MKCLFLNSCSFTTFVWKLILTQIMKEYKVLKPSSKIPPLIQHSEGFSLDKIRNYCYDKRTGNNCYILISFSLKGKEADWTSLFTPKAKTLQI
jgi:hypothetical protein